MRRVFHRAGIQFPQFLRVLEDPPQLGLKKFCLFLSEVKSRQLRDVRHVEFSGLGHAEED
jgi:hypothetical protein